MSDHILIALRLAMIESGLSNAEIARRCGEDGPDKATVMNIRNCTHSPLSCNLSAIATVLGMELRKVTP